MAMPELESPAFKQVLKEALAEPEVLEDTALAEAIRQGQQTEPISRETIMKILESGG